jgi:hypothetical protein
MFKVNKCPTRIQLNTNKYSFPMSFDDILLIKSRDGDILKRCNKVVEEFIEERGLIIYGGTAIDFALRNAKMNPIYPDFRLPFTDYDVFTHNLVQDAYDFAIKICAEFNSRDVGIINGVHMRTLRVSFRGIFIMDLNYMPKVLFDRLPRSKYTTINGADVMFVDPIVQMVDMHSSLSEPFKDPPREVYNHRVKKDIERFNLIMPLVKRTSDAHIDAQSNVARYRIVGDPSTFMLCGVTAAMAILDEVKGGNRVTMKDGEVIMRGGTHVELMTNDVGGGESYRRTADVLPAFHQTESARLYRADMSLYPCWRRSGSEHLAISSVQLVLKHLLARWVYRGEVGVIDLYWQLLDIHGAIPPLLMGTSVWPSVGAPNESLSAVYSRSLTIANARNDTKIVDEIKSKRPPNLYLSYNNAGRERDFCAWKTDQGWFNVSGEKIDN